LRIRRIGELMYDFEGLELNRKSGKEGEDWEDL